MTVISSPQNGRVKLVRKLQQQAKARRKARQWVAEGVRLLEDVWTSGARPEFVFFTEDALLARPALGDLVARLEAAGVSCWPVTPELMRLMSVTETPQGILAVVPWPELAVPEAPALVLVIDGWRDPGNLGTALRTAAAAGVPLVALTPGTVDAFNPKAVRAGMGAHFRVPLVRLDWETLRTRYPDHRVYLAEMDGQTRYDAADWSQPVLLVVGEEAHGLSEQARALPHVALRIPMVAGAESLNAAVAASLLIYAARRHVLR